MKLSMQATKKLGSFQLSADFTVTGEKVGLFGASGSGKSTLVAMLAGFLKPDSGEILLDGETLFSSSRSICIRTEKRRIALVFQHHDLFPHLDVMKNLLFGYQRTPEQLRRIEPDAVVRLLRLEELLKRSVTNLSGGEKQRVALGRAILANPRLLLMDEPLSALDDTLRFQIIPYLKSVSEEFNIPYIFISHSLVEMRLMSETVLTIDHNGVEQCSGEQLARKCMGTGPTGYINLLQLTTLREQSGMAACSWNGMELFLPLENIKGGPGIFELSSKDIILFKQHPEAISARNLIRCRVTDIFTSGNRLGVELALGNGVLIAEIVPDAARELAVVPGCELYAAFKASAFRRLTG